MVIGRLNGRLQKLAVNLINDNNVYYWVYIFNLAPATTVSIFTYITVNNRAVVFPKISGKLNAFSVL